MFKLEHAENILQDRKTHVKFSLEDTKTQFWRAEATEPFH